MKRRLRLQLRRKFYFEANLTAEVPEDFQAPTCVRCKAMYLDLESAEALERQLLPSLLERQSRHLNRLVRKLKERHAVPQKAIANVCGVTASSLSHVLAGNKRASVTLLRLLEALVMAPNEFRRHLAGQPLGQYDVRPFLVQKPSSQCPPPTWTTESEDGGASRLEPSGECLAL